MHFNENWFLLSGMNCFTSGGLWYANGFYTSFIFFINALPAYS